MPSPGDLGCAISPAACAASKTVEKAAEVKDSVTKVASFTTDPLGHLAGNLQKACEDLSRNLFGELVKVLHPDFSVSWFLEAYKVSFAVGIILFGVLLLLEIGSYRKRQIGTDEFIDNLTLYAPMYFMGVLMGPFLGNLLCRLVGAMCDGLVNWGGGDKGMAGAGGHLTKIIIAGTPQGMVGGNIVSIILFLVMLVAFILIAITLLFMYVTLYLSGSVFPVGWAWIVRSQNRQTAFKVLRVFVGILASQPLVFFMLGLVMAMTKANIFGNGNTGSGMTRLMSLLGAIMALFMVAMGPWALTKFAPIGINSTEGPSLGGGRGQGRTQRGGAGADSASDGQLGQMSRSGGSGQDAGAGMAAMGGGVAGGLAGGAAANGGSSSGGGLDNTKKGAAAGGLPGAAVGLAKDAADKINSGMNAQGDAAQESASSQSNAKGQESGGSAGSGGALAGSTSATGSDAATGSGSGSSERASAGGDSPSSGLSSLAQGEQGSDPGTSADSGSAAPSGASEQEPSGASGLGDLAGQDSSGADAGDSGGITPDTSSASSLGSHAASVPAASSLGASYAHSSQGQVKASPKQQGGVARFSNAVSTASKVSGKAGQVAGRAKGIAGAVQQQMGEQMNHQYGDRRQR